MNKSILMAFFYILISTLIWNDSVHAQSNNRVENAEDITLNSEIETIHELDGSVYYYSFSIERHGKFILELLTETEILDTYTILDKNKEEILSNPASSTWILGLPKGSYYLAVSTKQDPAVNAESFTLQINFEIDKYFKNSLGTNEIASATPIALNTTYQGFHYANENDYFTFQLTQKERVGIKGTYANATLYDSLTFKLLDEENNVINYTLATPEGGFFEAELSEGTYVIDVWGSSPEGYYDLEITTSDFKDLALNHWAVKEVQFLSDFDIIKGYQNGNFGPDDEVRRGQAALMFVRALNLDLDNRPNPGFEDITTDHIYYKEIAAVVDEGIFPKGETFNAFDPLKRSDMAYALVNAYDLQGTYNGDIVDVDKAEPNYPYINTLAANQVTNLYSDGTFKPESVVNRAQFSVFFARILDERFK
ncbi:S-layer homology domain-containing protein [Cytobacillus sp. Hm23]